MTTIDTVKAKQALATLEREKQEQQQRLQRAVDAKKYLESTISTKNQ